MAYSVKSKKSGKTYYLHSKEVTLKGGRKQRIYYFAGEIKKEALNDLPDGYKVIENARTGLPMLKKK
jgi:YHS domain-containing protein